MVFSRFGLVNWARELVKLFKLSQTMTDFAFHTIIIQFAIVEITPKTELKKVGSTGSMLPEHPRLSPGTHKT